MSLFTDHLRNNNDDNDDGRDLSTTILIVLITWPASVCFSSHSLMLLLIQSLVLATLW